VNPLFGSLKSNSDLKDSRIEDLAKANHADNTPAYS
jgi:hypothetical protein